MKIIDATSGFTGKPELEGDRVNVINAVRESNGSGNLFLTGKATGIVNIESVARKIDPDPSVHNLLYDEPKLAFFRSNSPQDDQAILRNTRDLAELFAALKGKASWYQSGGLKELWRPIQHWLWANGDEEKYEEWWVGHLLLLSKFDYRGAPIGKSALFDVSAFYPTMYLHYANWQEDDERERLWINDNMARIMLNARAAGKKVYPFVWGRFHDSNRVIPEQRFRLALRQMISFGIDGFAHWDWGGRFMPWSGSVSRDRRIIEEELGIV